ncbi:MAG: DUF2723 domain-containing protein [Muribaculaceae bacterium]|nr:DUF2723 domain-containing protein [Muribaculaceae bacterium]
MKKNSQFSILNFQIFKVAPCLAFLTSLIVYWLTVDPGTSYWDCPEYLLSALRLEIGHPPGNPGWTLAHRFVSCFFSGPVLQVRVVNMMAGLFTALAVMILCSISISLMRWIWPSRRDNIWRSVAISVASFSGSLCFAWSDSPWYSAVEAEVYAMSLFLSALTIWMALKWAFSFSRGARIRWLVALMYVIGFSLGVHQLNLLALPAIAMVMAFRLRGRNKAGFLRIAIAFIVGCAVVAFILKGLMPGSVALAGWTDLMAVNSLGLPYWSGAIAFWSVSLVVVVMGAVMSGARYRKVSAMLWCLAAVMLGFSVYIVIPIRACANPPVNEGNPSDVFRLADYLDRRQYGKAPLFYGRTPYSRVMRQERVSVDGNGDTLRDYSWNALDVKGRDIRPMVSDGRIPNRSRYLTDEDKALNDRISTDGLGKGYVVAGVRTEGRLTPELNMWFPRIYASSQSDVAAYRDWTGMDSASMVQVRISEAYDSLGRPVPMRDEEGYPVVKYGLRPSYLQSFTYMAVYQIGYMYLRYLMWNYSGRQNDVPSTGEIDHGNFITGFPLLDDMMLGPQSELPPELCADNHGRNVYWCVPFILGVIGVVWLFRGSRHGLRTLRMRRTAWVSLVLFLMTGIAIVFYLNQSPGEPRERDYSFMGSFWTFALWIAFGMLLLLRIMRRRWARGVALCIVCAVPIWMLAENWHDHDRSHRSAALDYASNLLESLDEDAILFVDGDNYIFPLWFAQEVMGVRRDVTVVCNAYLGSDWYVCQLMVPRYEYDGLRMMAREGDIALGNFNLVRFPAASSDTLPALEALRMLYSDSSATPSFKNRWLLMGKDSTDGWVFDMLSVPGKGAGSIAGLREVAEIDIVATNAASRYPRPVYWHQNLQKNKYIGFFPYTRQALFARKLMPLMPDSMVLVDESLDALPKLKWGGIDMSPYPGVDVASQAAVQRSSLIRLAESLSNVGRHDQALHVAKSALIRYPSRIIPFTIRHHVDSAYFEARQLAWVLRRSGLALADTVAVDLADCIESEDSLRTVAFRRYRQSLPAWRRSALSPDSRNHSILP